MAKFAGLFSVFVAFLSQVCRSDNGVDADSTQTVFVPMGSTRQIHCTLGSVPPNGDKNLTIQKRMREAAHETTFSWLVQADMQHDASKIQDDKRGSIIIIKSADLGHSGVYACQAKRGLKVNRNSYRVVVIMKAKRFQYSQVYQQTDRCSREESVKMQTSLKSLLCGDRDNEACAYRVFAQCRQIDRQVTVVHGACSELVCSNRGVATFRREVMALDDARLSAIMGDEAKHIKKEIIRSIDPSGISCVPGYYLLRPRDVCLPCRPGTYSSNGINCVPCAKGLEYRIYRYGGKTSGDTCIEPKESPDLDIVDILPHLDESAKDIQKHENDILDIKQSLKESDRKSQIGLILFALLTITVVVGITLFTCFNKLNNRVNEQEAKLNSFERISVSNSEVALPRHHHSASYERIHSSDLVNDASDDDRLDSDGYLKPHSARSHDRLHHQVQSSSSYDRIQSNSNDRSHFYHNIHHGKNKNKSRHASSF